MSGCDAVQHAEWTEDVRLADGRTILLTRDEEFDGPRQIFQPPVPSSYGFAFRMPGSDALVSWTSGIDLVPVAILIDNGKPILLTTPLPSGLLQHECPDPPYLAFAFVDHQWTTMPLASLPARGIAPNMTGILAAYDAATMDGRRPHLSATDVERRLPDDLRGKFVDFSNAGQQTFGARCVPPFNRLLRNRSG